MQNRSMFPYRRHGSKKRSKGWADAETPRPAEGAPQFGARSFADVAAGHQGFGANAGRSNRSLRPTRASSCGIGSSGTADCRARAQSSQSRRTRRVLRAAGKTSSDAGGCRGRGRGTRGRGAGSRRDRRRRRSRRSVSRRWRSRSPRPEGARRRGASGSEDGVPRAAADRSGGRGARPTAGGRRRSGAGRGPGDPPGRQAARRKARPARARRHLRTARGGCARSISRDAWSCPGTPQPTRRRACRACASGPPPGAGR